MPRPLRPRLPLIRAMKLRGVSVKGLAKETGIHAGTISHIRNGRQTPETVTAALIADALGSTIASLGLTPSEGGARD